MSIAKAAAFIIRAMDFRESDLIVTAFSEEFGKFSCIAKGARKSDRFGAALDLLTLTELLFYEGKSLKLLKDAAIIESYPKLKRDYERLETALHCARALNLLVKEGQEERQVFHLFGELLQELETDKDPRVLKLGFQLKLVNKLGFGPQLEHCSLCKRSLTNEAWFSFQAGGLTCSDCKGDVEIGSRAAKILWMLLRLPLSKLNRIILSDDVLELNAKLLSKFIAYHLQPI